MRIAIIGAGAAGLAAARHASAVAENEVTVFEQADRVGGTWVYTERVGVDEYGLRINSSMYHNLVCNGSKDIICYPDVPFDPQTKSYPRSTQVLEYLESFVEKFNLAGVIKTRHQVLRVQPVVDTTLWTVTVRNLIEATETSAEYDAVMVCNGHFSVPAYPSELLGRDVYGGLQVHSHDYRRPDAFSGKSVLVIGSGPSGTDIAVAIKGVAATLCISAHGDGAKNMAAIFGENAVRPDVLSLTETGARFADDTEEAFDAIVYGTGYLYEFPFLAPECGIIVSDGYHVQPLFKHCVHIDHPTMFLIGIPSFDLPFIVMDTQARLCVALLRNEWQLPDAAEMRRITAADLERCWAAGYNRRQAHKVFSFFSDYVGELEQLAHLTPLRPVIYKMFAHNVERSLSDFKVFRTEQYTIVDDETFTSYLEPEL